MCFQNISKHAFKTFTQAIEAQPPLVPISITSKLMSVKRWEPMRGGHHTKSKSVIHHNQIASHLRSYLHVMKDILVSIHSVQRAAAAGARKQYRS